MLILTRRTNETIRIGDDVSIMVLGINGNQVRIGVEAPKEISVHREEVYQRILQELSPGSASEDPGIKTHRTPVVTVRSRNRFLGGLGLRPEME